MGHILEPKCHVPIAISVRLLLAMTMEIWNRECGPFRPIFAVFAISGQVGNTISPWGQGPSQRVVATLVADAQGSVALEIRISSFRLAGVLQLTVCATLPQFAFLALFCPAARPLPRGTAGSQRDSKPNPEAWKQRGYHGP